MLRIVSRASAGSAVRRVSLSGYGLWCLLLVAVASVFVTVFSYTTSPLYSEFGDVPDSVIFQIIGKYWAEGAVPYRDLWDMKGPFIFLVNALGYGLAGSRTGVYAVQMVCMSLTLWAMFGLLCRHFSRKAAFCLTLLSLAGLSYVYEGGNLTEEYLLPLLTWAFFFLQKWVDEAESTGDVRHRAGGAAVYGAAVGLSLMSRLTNALGLSAAVSVVAAVLLWRREGRNLLSNVATFTVGFLLTTVPFVAYFHAQGALSEMWNATFVYAFDYAFHPIKDASVVKVHYFVLSYFNSMLLLALSVGVIASRRSLSLRPVLWLFSAVFPLVWFCLGNGFAHYGMTVYPLFGIAMTEMRRLSLARLRLAVALLLLVGFGSKVRFMLTMYHWTNAELGNIRAYMAESPPVNRASFLAYNCSPSVYLALGVRPGAPLFSIQDQGMERIPAWKEFVESTFRRSRVEWVLLSYVADEKPGIQQVLDENYTLVREDSTRHLRTFRAKRAESGEAVKK